MSGPVATGHLGAAEVPTSSSLGRVLRNGAINLAALGLNAAFNLVAVFALARHLGKEGLGRYYTTYALIVFVQLVTEAGCSTILTQRIVRAPGTWKATVAEALGLLALIVAASTLVFLALGAARSAWGAVDAWPTLAAAALACVGMHVQRFAAAVFQAFERLEYESLARVVQGALFAGATLTLLGRGGSGLGRALALLALSHVVEALLLASWLQWRWRCAAFRLEWGSVRGWLSESVALGLGDVLRRMTWQLDTLLLGLLQPPAVVGIYSIAYRPLGPLNWIPRAISTAAFPSFARMAHEDRDALAVAFAASLRILWFASLPIAVAISIGAEPLVLVLAGREYLESAIPMRILIWIAGFSFLSFQYRFLFAALGKRHAYAWLVGLILLLEAVLEGLLIPRLGYFGACAGSFSGELIFTASGLWLCRRAGILRVDWPAMANAVVAAAAMALALYPARHATLPWLGVGVALASALYVLLCVALGVLRRDEVRRLLRRVRG